MNDSTDNGSSTLMDAPTRPCQMGSIPLPDMAMLFDALEAISDVYGDIHPALSVVLCVAGFLTNLINVVILTRPTMRSPINTLLCAVAVCDMIVVLSNTIFVAHYFMIAPRRCRIQDYSKLWAHFIQLHAHLSVIFHSTSLWLTVTLAQIRFLTVSNATKAPRRRITSRSALIIFVGTLVVNAVANLPNIITFRVVAYPAPPGSCYETNYIEEMRFARSPSSATGNVTVPFMWNMEPKAQSCLMFKVTFWINGLMYKFVPCFLLTVFIGLLLRLMKGLNERRRALAQLMHRHKMPKDNTTPMLVAVLGIFLITELPQGLLSIGTGVFSSDEFHQRIYLPLGNLMDLLSILNSSVNFVIYCTMSTKFRAEFRKAICIRVVEKTYRRLHPKVGAAMRPRAGSQELFELLECKKPAALIKLLNSVSSPRDGTALLPARVVRWRCLACP